MLQQKSGKSSLRQVMCCKTLRKSPSMTREFMTMGLAEVEVVDLRIYSGEWAAAAEEIQWAGVGFSRCSLEMEV